MVTKTGMRIRLFQAMGCVLGVTIPCALLVAQAHAAATSPGKFVMRVLEIPDINRGAGLAIVLQTPGGRTYLYDTGTGYPDKDGWASDHNSGRDLIAPFLRQRGVKELDGVIISHAHYDHFGGLVWLVDNFPIKKIFDCGYRFGGKSDANYTAELAHYDKLRERFKQRPGVYQAAHAGDKLALDDGLDVEVIAPPKEFFHELHPEKRPKNDPAAHYMLNTNSLMLRIRHGQIVFLLPGDIELEDQVKNLLPSVPREKLKCDILVAPGHGLHSAPEFADATRPQVTVASVFTRWARNCSARRVFGAVGSKVYVTGLHGNVQVVSDGQRYEITTQREAE
ncbi:MBL fold metallo-hydrolase [Candidatus Sumerlaeota bacterium]|nr:MBL fold metallo-hydrolase [Candidatus Sumerlaeota bacterium]